MENVTTSHVVDVSRTSSDRYPEAIILLTVGVLSSTGNFISLAATIIHSRFRCTSMAILCHHTFLDLLKSLYLFPFGINLLTSQITEYCNWIGSSYVFLMTTSAYNFLALVVHEEYELTSSYHTGENWCVLFGITIIWFMSLLLNLGVSIIPFNTRYIKDIGNCMFPYGKNESYIVHFLWISLVTFAVVISFKKFFQMYLRINSLKHKFRWDVIQNYLADDTMTEESSSQYFLDKDEFMRGKTSCHYLFHHRRILVYICMVTSFALFWYPLFLLTVVDFYFIEPKILYRILTIFAWCQPILTPLFCVTILRTIKFKDDIIRDLSTNLLPLTSHFNSRTFSSRNITTDEQYGIENDHFQTQEETGLETSFIGSDVTTDYVIKTASSSVRSTPTRPPTSIRTPSNQVEGSQGIETSIV